MLDITAFLRGYIMDSNTIENLVNGAVGLLGAVIGGGASLWATKIQINQQNRSEDKKSSAERKNAEDIIKTFLMNEIQQNVKKMEWLKQYFNVGYDWQEMWPDIKSVEPTVLQFKEYENVKYKLLEINTNESLRTIEIYQMFYMIHNCNTIDFRPNYFTRNEFNFIARRFEFAEEMVIEYFNKKFAIFID